MTQRASSFFILTVYLLDFYFVIMVCFVSFLSTSGIMLQFLQIASLLNIGAPDTVSIACVDNYNPPPSACGDSLNMATRLFQAHSSQASLGRRHTYLPPNGFSCSCISPRSTGSDQLTVSPCTRCATASTRTRSYSAFVWWSRKS